MAAKPSAAASGSALDRLSPVGKFGLGMLFVVLFAALYYVVFYDEVATKYDAEKNKEAGLGEDLDRAKQSRELYQKDLDEKARREQLALQQKKILPDDPETPAFLSGLQSVATIAGVNLTSWSPMEESRQEFFAKIPMKLTLKGKFHQVVKFFHGVGQLDRIINLEDIKLKTTTKLQPEEVEVDVECLATAFRSTKPGEMAAAAPKKRAGGH
jgi:type IV pilus assembly protein PilO